MRHAGPEPSWPVTAEACLPSFLHFLSCALLWAVGLANRLGPLQ
jgi:hypothetical protein